MGKKIAAWALIALGALLALISVIPAEGQDAEQTETVILVIGVLLALAGIVLLRKKKGKNAAPTPQARVSNASTCTAGVLSAAQARTEFAEARRNAKKIKSPGYIWRTAGDGEVCACCAANAGKRFSWDKEPPGGHAGAKAKCRCYPETIVPR